MGKTLAEFGFSGAEDDPEATIAAAWEETISLVEQLSQNPEITQILPLFADFTNGSLAVKAHLFDFDNAPLHLPGGSASAEDLMRVAEGEAHVKSVPKEVREAMRLAKALYTALELPLVIDVAGDSYFGTIFVDRLLGSKSEFLKEYARRWADAKNISSYLRIRAGNIPSEHFKRFFIEGGYIKRKDFGIYEKLELDAIPSRLVFSPYGKPLADAVSRLTHENSFEPLAQYIDNMLENFLRQNVYISFGLDVVLAYSFLRWRELRAIGAIVRMKKANIDRDRILERVRYGDL